MKTLLSMKSLFSLSLLSAAALAGCATSDTRMASAECKVAPVTTKSAVNKAGPVSELDRKWAEAQLRNSDYRRQQLASRGPLDNTLEDALADCDRR